PPAEDFDAFEKLGNPGWNWNDLEKYVHRIEKFQKPTQDQIEKELYSFNTDTRGHTGAIKTAFPVSTSSSLEIPYLQAMNSLDIPFTDGYGGKPCGVFHTTLTMDTETHARSYAANAYYTPNRTRPNLMVLTQAHVAKVIFADNTASEDLVATGVEFLFGNNTSSRHVVHAKREVILCTGTVVSPQILELSGIGRSEVLEAIGIETKIELPGVGENLQDHQVTNLNYELDNQVDHETWDRMADPVFAAEQLKLQPNGEGMHCRGIVSMAFLPFSKFNPEESDAFFTQAETNVKKQLASSAYPGLAGQLELQLQVLRNPEVADTEILCFPGRGFYTLLGPPEPGKQHLCVFVFVQHPFSRGSIHCKTNDPFQSPDIDPNGSFLCFCLPNILNGICVDLGILVEQIKFVRKLVEIDPLKSLIIREIEPGPERESNEDIRGFVSKHKLFIRLFISHACGSCSMLPREKNGVVDPTLKVYGTRNLRIADLSIIPLQPLGHTQSIAYIVGMKAADIILVEKKKSEA
ncbi:GMC oxidoreductase, partial [Sphaerobolus stellatus SS14]